ncbi:MAG: WecB/TagA/CpsF family glycosyltransferase [Pedobacter sp.]|uniref:WecB/TagA/CpsF family glycosyltransferase n=1 Tax=Pedobacter sp. TaxID=1411316 RepID=UPI003392E1DE
MNNIKPTGFDYNLYTGILNDLSYTKKTVINTINQYSYCIAENDPTFKKALQDSEVLLPDGDGIVIAERILTGKKIKKISGAQLHDHFLSMLAKKKGRCFYLGSSPSTLAKIKANLDKQYPEIQAGFYSPPFKTEFTEQDNQDMINAINDFAPEVLFIGLTAPKQEKWSHDHKEAINAKVICAIGAVFDFYAGTVKRPSTMMINMKMEWLGRLVSEPKRMWRRYLYFGPIYLYHILKRKLDSGDPIPLLEEKKLSNEFKVRKAS